MATPEEYQAALAKAQAAGDQEAVSYFQSKAAPAGAPPVDPTGGGAWSPILHGLTFGYGDELAGLGGGIASTLKGEGFRKGYDFMREDVRQGERDYAARHPYVAPALEIAGSIPTMVAAGPAAAARPLASAAGGGALYGYGSGEGGVQNRLEDAGIGATVGAGTAGALNLGGRVLGTVFPRVAPRSELPDFQRALGNLEARGIPVTASEQIASPAGRLSERASGAYFGMGDNIAARPNTVTSRLMEHANFAPQDIQTGELSQAAVQRAQQRFSQGYDQALTGVRVDLPTMDPQLAQIQQAYGTLLPFEQRTAINNILGDFRDQITQNRTIGGRDYQRLRSQLGKMQESAARNTNLNYLAPVYGRLRDTLDMAFINAAPRQASQRVAELNSQYGAFKILQKAEGNPEALGTLANDAWRNGRRVNPDFVRLARDYQMVALRGGYQTSGTAENTAGLGVKGLFPPVLATVRAGIGAPWQAHVRPRIPAALRNAPLSFIAGTQAGGYAGQGDIGNHEYR